MRFKTTIKYIVIMLLAVSLSGCATALTFFSPTSTKLVQGKKKAGAFNSYEYQYSVRGNKIFLERTPLCDEVAQTLKVEQKREIGYGPALMELPIFGLGLVDIANAHAISVNSKKVTQLAEYNTGKLMTCGKRQPAANEKVIIENTALNLYRTARTDQDGVVNLNKVLPGINGKINLNVRLASNQNVAFFCMYVANR